MKITVRCEKCGGIMRKTNPNAIEAIPNPIRECLQCDTKVRVEVEI